MGDLVLVQVSQGTAHRTEPRLGVPLAERPVLADYIADVAVGRKVHDNVNFGACAKELLDVNAVGVLQVVDNLQLPLQVVVQLLTVRIFDMHHFNGVVAAVLHALVHVRLSAGVDALEAAVATPTEGVRHFGWLLGYNHNLKHKHNHKHN